MISQGKISVIIPSYNRYDYLGRAIHSVMRQTHPCAEIIIIDDGSTDDSKKLIDTIKPGYGIALRYYYQANKGPAAARNLGIRKARYPLLAFLDSDDHWYKKKLSLQFKAMEQNPSYSISHTRERWLRRGEHLNQKKIHIPQHGNIFSHCLQLCAVGMSTVMVKRALFETVGFFNESLPCCEDYDFWLRVSARYSFFLLDEALTVKEGGRDDQVSQQYRVGMDSFRIKALVDLLETVALSEEQFLATRDELQRKCSIYGKGCQKHNNIEELQKLNMIVEKFKLTH